MPASPKVSQAIQFLNDLDPAKFSIGQDGDNLKQISKRSRLCNFFHWVIHLITFTLVSQNRELDRITSRILREIQDDSQNPTDEEKMLAEKAIRNLSTVIKNNGGSQGNAIEEMLSTLAKIQSLPVVQNLSGQVSDEEQEKDLSEKDVSDDVFNNVSDDSVDDVFDNVSDDSVDDVFDDVFDNVSDDSVDAEVPPDTNKNQVEAPSTTINFQETRLQDLLQNLFDQKAFDDDGKNICVSDQSKREAAKSIAKLLPELKGSVPLSDDLLTLLGKAFNEIDNITLKNNLSPELLVCIVKNSLENANLIALLPVVHAVKCTKPFEKEQFIAVAYGFKLYRNTLKANTPAKEIPTDQIRDFLFVCIFDEAIFRDYFSEDEMIAFIKDFFELVVAQTSDDNQEKIKNFNTAIWLRNRFGKQHEQLALETLCQVKNMNCLAHLCMYSEVDVSDFAIKTILKSNPPKADDSDDSFFQEFVEKLMEKIENLRKKIDDDPNNTVSQRIAKGLGLMKEEKFVSKIAEYVFANECAERQAMLASKLSPGIISLELEHIPVQAWEDINDSILLEVAYNLSRQNNPAPTNSALQAFVKGLSADHLYDLITQDVAYNDFWSSLLLLCPFSIQVQFVSKVFDSKSYNHHCCLEKIQSQLNLNVWKEASKQNSSRKYRDINRGNYSPKIFAHIVNGQINNQQFLQDFFKDYFKIGGDLEKQKACVTYLEPAVFKFDKPEDISHSIWYRFFRALREIPDQQHAQDLLIHSTLHLFNSPALLWLNRELIYTLTVEQMELLPIQQYKRAEIQLLLACLTGQLDDKLLAAANSLDDQQSNTFFQFFESAYSKSDNTPAELERLYCFSFKKDKNLLKNFLLWVLDRPSITPALSTWTWINRCYQGKEILVSNEIKKDNTIQGHIKKLNLSINKPKGMWG